jgi:DNA-binding response OmpR family regulator
VNSPIVTSSVIALKPRGQSRKLAPGNAAAPDEPHYKPRSLAVLVVEPSAETAGLVDRVLRRMPWFEAQVTLAGSIEAARFALRAGDVDVVLLAEAADDETLAFARELAALAGDPPVIMTSPLLATEVEYEAIGFGVAACIETAEITPRVIETYIRNALWRRAALQPAANPPVDASGGERARVPRAVGDTANVVRLHRRPVGA